MEKDALAVGDSTTLEIIFSTGSYSNQVSKAPSILTNEAQGAKNVTIKANIVTKPDSTYPIVIQPPKIEFAAGDSTETMEFAITNKSDGVLSPRIVSAPRRLVSITLPQSIQAGESTIGSVTLKKAGLKAGFEKSVTIQLNDEPKSRFTIPIKRSIIGQAVVVPAGGH